MEATGTYVWEIWLCLGVRRVNHWMVDIKLVFHVAVTFP
jgi:hypothetical protein